MPTRAIHCRICGHAISGYDFGECMARLRRHRKAKHPAAHKKSIRKAVETGRKRR